MTRQLNIVLQKLITEISKEWPAINSIFLSALQYTTFNQFLAVYRGHKRSCPPNNDEQQESIQLQALIAFKLLEVIKKNILNFYDEIVNFSPSESTYLLNYYEKVLNLSLYYWIGNADRNFQFRTLIHYCDLEGAGDLLITLNNTDWYISFSEYGIRISQLDDEHIPEMLPMSQACKLWEFSNEFCLYFNAILDPQIKFKQEKKLFSRIRTVHKQLNLLIDEWEYRNTLISVEYTALRANRSENITEEELRIQKKMFEHRNFMAEWCMLSFKDLQTWTSILRTQSKFCPDILSELDLVDTLILAGVQKIFLPASVSRHEYTATIVKLVADWCNARLIYHKDDLSTCVLKNITELALNPENAVFKFPEIIFERMFNYKLSFDLCTPTKAFSFMYSKDMHYAITSITAIATWKKLSTDFLDDYWASNIISTIQMPETFLSSHSPPKNIPGIKAEVKQRLALEVLNILAKIKTTSENAQIVNWAIEIYRRWRESND